VWQAAVGGLQNVADSLGYAAGLVAYNNVPGDLKVGFGAGLGGYIDYSQDGEGGHGIELGFGDALGWTAGGTLTREIPSALTPSPQGGGGSFGYNFSASGKIGTIEGDAELNGNAIFSSNGNYQIAPFRGGANVGPGGLSEGPQVNGNIFNASALNGRLLQGQATLNAGTGIFFFAGIHAGGRW